MLRTNSKLITVLMLVIPVVTACLKQSDLRDQNRQLESVVGIISERLVPDRREGIADIQVKAHKRTVTLLGETDNPLLRMQVVDSLESLGFTVTDSIQLLPSVYLDGINKAIADLSVINLRTEPDHSAELVSQALLGTPLKILKRQGSWVLVQTPDKYISWAEAGAVKMMTESEWQSWRSASRVIYINKSGWIYKNIDSKDVISDIIAGCIMKNGYGKGAFLQVILPDGREGFVEKKYVKDFDSWKKEKKPESEDILSAAEGIMGIPYLWGGSSVKGVDCSGFVQTVFFMNGIILSRDASLQALHGELIDTQKGWNDLEKGDLLFFGSVRDSRPRVTHVAIYKGDREFIHSATRVNVNSLDSTRANYSRYRKNSFLLSRRILGYEGSEGITFVRDHPWY